MGKSVIHYKTLDELSFNDLYVDVPEQTYPALRGLVRELFEAICQWKYAAKTYSHDLTHHVAKYTSRPKIIPH